MNKRIKTIWEETTRTCTPREGDWVSVSSKNIQDFTEQIIKECAHIAWLNSTEDNISHIKIKDHFGVKG